jgi:hypothetical protein
MIVLLSANASWLSENRLRGRPVRVGSRGQETYSGSFSVRPSIPISTQTNPNQPSSIDTSRSNRAVDVRLQDKRIRLISILPLHKPQLLCWREEDVTCHPLKPPHATASHVTPVVIPKRGLLLKYFESRCTLVITVGGMWLHASVVEASRDRYWYWSTVISSRMLKERSNLIPFLCTWGNFAVRKPAF